MSVASHALTGLRSSGSCPPTLLAISQITNQTNVIEALLHSLPRTSLESAPRERAGHRWASGVAGSVVLPRAPTIIAPQIQIRDLRLLGAAALRQPQAFQRDRVDRDDDARARHRDCADLGAQHEAERLEDAGGDRQGQAVVAHRPGE